MAHWLITNTTYGTWLPGDPRGSVTSVRDKRDNEGTTSSRREHDLPEEPYEEHLPGIQRSAERLRKGAPIYLTLPQAERVLSQFQETATFRGWTLVVVSIMSNHYHLIVIVPDETDPARVLADFKAYASRVLNREYGKPASDTWWTSKGSTRKLKDQYAEQNAIRYVVERQPNPLVAWSAERGQVA